MIISIDKVHTNKILYDFLLFHAQDNANIVSKLLPVRKNGTLKTLLGEQLAARVNTVP